jgi:nucleoid-associated protein YgaU
MLRQLQQPIDNQPQATPPPLAKDTLKAEASDSIYALTSEQQSTTEPRAKLRNEVPRPLATGPRTQPVAPRVAPLAINGTAVSGFHANVVAAPSSTSASIQNSTPSIHAQPADDISLHAGTDFPTLATSETQSTAANLTPLRLPSSTEVDEPRTHIVVDGDSLAKLAGRYLDDPRRAEEILELNRGLLSDPQLLPIGVELLIPSRSADTSVGGNSPQSYLPRAVAIHSAHGHGLVPVRPIPTGSTLTPRARLVNPRSAE